MRPSMSTLKGSRLTGAELGADRHPLAIDSSSSSQQGIDNAYERNSAILRQRSSPRKRLQYRSSENGEDLEAEDCFPSTSLRPPSFAESQFQTIIRRQRKRRVASPALERLETGQVRSKRSETAPRLNGTSTSRQQEDECHANLGESSYDHKGALLKVGSNRGDPTRAGPLNSYRFAGWGTMSMLEITSEHFDQARQRVAGRRPRTLLGQWKAAAIAGNAVTGSIFYALPSVFAASGVWAPVALLLAALLMTPVLIVVDSLASGLSGSNAGSYSYLINVTGRTLALVAGAVTILDAISTGAVSASTAASYVAAETPSISGTVYTILFLVGLTAVCLLGLRDSSTIALSMFTLHVSSIIALGIAACVGWGRSGSSILIENWNNALYSADSAAHLGGKGIARAIFDGTVVAFVGLTGFETTVAYAGAVKPGAFRKALRNIWVIVALLEAPIALLVLAQLPFTEVLSANNVLALLAAVSGGRGLELFVIIDAAIVLCGGILTGAISCSGVLMAMSDDGTLPSVLAWIIPKTGAPAWCLAVYLGLCVLMCATASFSQLTVSSIFSIVFLGVLTFFGIAAVLVLYSRPFLPRSHIPLWITLLSLAITITSLVGNIVLSPLALAQTVAYAGVLIALILTWANRVPLVRIVGAWLPTQISSFSKVVPSLAEKAAIWVTQQRKEAKAVFMTNTDELSALVSAILYIKENEPSIGHVILVHCYRSGDATDIPEELEANHQLVDEAFPTITVDLVFVEAGEEGFGPVILELLSHRFHIPLSRFFIACPTSATATTLSTEEQELSDRDEPRSKRRQKDLPDDNSPVPAAGARRRKYRLQDLGGVRIILD